MTDNPALPIEDLTSWLAELTASAQCADEGDGWAITDQGRQVRSRDQRRLAILLALQATEREQDELKAALRVIDPDLEGRAGSPCDYPHCVCDFDAICDIAIDKARVAELEGALRPFAEAWLENMTDADRENDQISAWETSLAMSVTFGDFYRAEQALSLVGGGKGPSGAESAAMGPLPHVATEAEPCWNCGGPDGFGPADDALRCHVCDAEWLIRYDSSGGAL